MLTVPTSPVGGTGESRAPERRPRGPVRTAIAIALLVALPLVPAALAGGATAALVGLPAESIAVVVVLRLLERRGAQVAVAVGFGLVVAVALALAGIDAGYEAALAIHFDPLDVQQLGDAFGVLRGAIGGTAANAAVVLLVVAAAAVIAGLAWAALRTSAAVGSAPRPGMIALTTAATVWVLAGATGVQVAGHPVAATASLHAIAASASHAADGIAAITDLPHRIATDPYRDTPPTDLLTALRGKDVVIAFIESYGETALQGGASSTGVDRVLRDGDARLSADGYGSRSAHLTSPTFGGLSWLAHSTLQTGLWVDRQPVYSRVIRSDRLTLSGAFAGAGWRTVGIVPSNTEPWPFGTSFYRFDTLLDATGMGYRGPAFGYARVPDQYTWKVLADDVLAGDGQPVMAEVDLVSSHTPWAPLPELVPWSELGDGSIYRSQAAQGESASDVWQDPVRVQRAYAASIRYSLGAMLTFLHETDDPDLVVVVLGDHQPATIVSGPGAGHDVPISIISKDPAVLDAIDSWRWHEGLRPAADGPVWPMSDFRDRFLDAFSAR